MLSGSSIAANEVIGSHVSEPAHLQLGNDETAIANRVNNLASVHVSIRLDHSELGLFTTSEGLSGGSVSVVSDLELSGVDSDDGANVEGLLGDSRASHALEEHSAVFQIVL